MSTIILYMSDFESPLLDKYKKELNLEVKDANDILSMIPGTDNKDNQQNLNINNLQIQNNINYNKLLEEILNDFSFNLNIFSFNYQSDNFILSLNLNDIKAFKKKELNKSICLFSSIDNWNIIIETPNINDKKKKLIENNENITINYDFKDEIIKGNLKSVYFNTNMEDIIEVWDKTKFILNQINWDIILCKMDFKLDDFVFILDQFKFSISEILFINFKDKGDKDNAFYITLLQIIMNNQKGNKLIYEKELKIDYFFTSSTENDIGLKFNDLNIEFSQQDISFLISSIKYPKKKEEEIYQRQNTVVQSFHSNNFQNENKIDLLGFENLNSPSIQPRMSAKDVLSQRAKKFSISFIIDIPKFNLSFDLNDYTKLMEISLELSSIKLKNIFYENLLNHKTNSEFTYSILLGKLNLLFFFSKNNTFNILSKRKILSENAINDDNIIEEEKDIKINNINQIEIIKNLNGYIINLNQNEVNVRIDAFILIYYYFNGTINTEELVNNLEQKDANIINTQNLNQIQFNFNDSVFQLCTSFSGKENLFLYINKFIIIYTSYHKFPYGTYIITLNQLSAEINIKNNIRKLFFSDKDFLQIKMTISKELISVNVEIGELTINLSYRDLVSFLRAYLINIKMLDDNIKKSEEILKNKEQNNKNNIIINRDYEKRKEVKNNIYEGETTQPNLSINKKMVLTGEFNLEKLDITLIDNSKGSYSPFLNIINNKIYFVLNPDKSFETSFSLLLYSYNYIA